MPKSCFKILLVIIFNTHLLYSQTYYSLQDGLQIGLEKNYDIRLVKNDLKIHDNDVSRGNAGQLPSVSLDASYGGSLNNSHTLLSDGNSFNDFNNNVSVGINVSYTIFNGFGLQANYNKLKELRVQSELNLRNTVEDFVSSFIAEYYNLVKQVLQLKNLQMSVELSKERLNITEASFIIGSASGLDYQQSQVDYNADLSALISQEEIVEKTKINLNKMLSFNDLYNGVCIVDSIIVFDSTLDRKSIFNDVLNNNVGVLKSIQERTISEIDYKKALSRNYPYIKLYAGYGYDNSWYSTQKKYDYGLNFGITAGYTIFDGMNRKREQQNARITIDNAQIMCQQYLNSLESDFNNLWFAYTNNLKLWRLEKRNQIVAHSNFEIAMERYRLRELSGLELREAQLGLLKSEERLLSTEYNIKMCEISLLLISGNLLKHVF